MAVGMGFASTSPPGTVGVMEKGHEIQAQAPAVSPNAVTSQSSGLVETLPIRGEELPAIVLLLVGSLLLAMVGMSRRRDLSIAMSTTERSD